LSARGLFVTGTDTNVGKTIVSAALMHTYRRHHDLHYYKPIQTGIEVDDDAQVVQTLGLCPEHEICRRGARLAKPLSPHLSARLAGTRLEIDSLANPLTDAPGRFWIVEGAGGVLVPLNERELMIDFMCALSLPVVVVARTGLGTINHTLLTLTALRARKLAIHSVVMVGEPNPDNLEAIKHYGDVSHVFHMPIFTPPTSQALQDWAGAYANI
jgi:dethiobiotin synthetase